MGVIVLSFMKSAAQILVKINYPMSTQELAILKEYLNDTLKRGFIHLTNFSASVPIFFIPTGQLGTVKTVYDSIMYLFCYHRLTGTFLHSLSILENISFK